jgi:hypothetical protein
VANGDSARRLKCARKRRASFCAADCHAFILLPGQRSVRNKLAEFRVTVNRCFAANAARWPMSYRVYGGPRGSAGDFLARQGAHAQGARVALLTEGDDGAGLGKEEIAAALRHAENSVADKGA